ncbi:hypothetical protein U703_02640 [Rhodobacter capsulatus YW1]|nr:hypothetical protein U703_02640 [Rhodobacter capsulatus YW1]
MLRRLWRSVTIQFPPMPEAGMVSPPPAAWTAENLSCTPARADKSRWLTPLRARAARN